MGDSREAKRVANRLQARSLTLPYVDQELALDLGLTRRDVLKIAGYGSLAAFLAACGSTSASSSSITATGGKMSLGSYNTDPGSKAGTQAIVDAFKTANGGTNVTLNVVDHGTFQNTITNYLQGTPQDIFTWFSGHRMRFFADRSKATTGTLTQSPPTTTRGPSSTARTCLPRTTIRSRRTGTTSRRFAQR